MYLARRARSSCSGCPFARLSLTPAHAVNAGDEQPIFIREIWKQKVDHELVPLRSVVKIRVLNLQFLHDFRQLDRLIPIRLWSNGCRIQQKMFFCERCILLCSLEQVSQLRVFFFHVSGRKGRRMRLPWRVAREKGGGRVMCSVFSFQSSVSWSGNGSGVIDAPVLSEYSANG